MLPEWTVVGFSGHRKLADPKAAADGIHNVLERLAANYSPLVSVSSAARGADTLFVEKLRAENCPAGWCCLFPKPVSNRISAPPCSGFFRHRKRAMRVEEVAGEESAEGAYMETGILTADRADIMAVVWDGKPAAGFGGTGDVVAYLRGLESL